VQLQASCKIPHKREPGFQQEEEEVQKGNVWWIGSVRCHMLRCLTLVATSGDLCQQGSTRASEDNLLHDQHNGCHPAFMHVSSTTGATCLP
jgi:hypothetical protein